MVSKTAPTYYTKLWVGDDLRQWHGEILFDGKSWLYYITSPAGVEVMKDGFEYCSVCIKAADRRAAELMGSSPTKW